MIIIKTTTATNFVTLNTGKIKILHDSKMADSRKDSVGNQSLLNSSSSQKENRETKQ